jgi:hypothetical protein
MQEKKMRKFICRYIAENVPTAKVTNENGNIFVVKGDADNYPCIVAHLDQVQNLHSADFKVLQCDNILLGYSAINKRTEGLGADDKNGIYIALKCLQRYDNIKIALFRDEEIGCIGSSECDITFFDNCKYILQCDRRGNSDLITNVYNTPICSDEFIEAIHPENFGYKQASGMLTDVYTLIERGVNVSCLNISCGYFNPHTDEETTDINGLMNCYNFVCWIIENVTDVYPFTPPYNDYKDTCNDKSDYYDWGNNWDYSGESKDNKDYYLYDAGNTIYDILEYNPNISFKELWQTYGEFIKCGKREAKRLYNDIINFYGYDTKTI